MRKRILAAAVLLALLGVSLVTTLSNKKAGIKSNAYYLLELYNDSYTLSAHRTKTLSEEDRRYLVPMRGWIARGFLFVRRDYNINPEPHIVDSHRDIGSAEECENLCFASVRKCIGWHFDGQVGECKLWDDVFEKVTGSPHDWIGEINRNANVTRTYLEKRFFDVSWESTAEKYCRDERILRGVRFFGGFHRAPLGVWPQGLSPKSCCLDCAKTVGCAGWQNGPEGCELMFQIDLAVPVSQGGGETAGVVRFFDARSELNPDMRARAQESEIKRLLPAENSDAEYSVGEDSAPVKGESRAWTECPERDVDISFIMTSRNDDCVRNDTEHCVHLRMLNAFKTILTFDWGAHDISCEVVVVEWNPQPDRPSLHHIAQPQKSRNCAVRFLTVPSSVHNERLGGKKVTMLEDQAKNAALRRSNGRYLVSTNPDALFAEQMLRTIAKLIKQPTLFKGVIQVQRVCFDQSGAPYHFPTVKDRIVSGDGLCDIELGGNPAGHLSWKRSIAGTDQQPILLCNHCGGDFMMAPCEAWMKSRAYAETAHTREQDNEVACWMQFGNLTEVGTSYP
eukprot:Hpha_TRINITY_DN16803_c1_g3::TRINITY_DN16803_c1_g3_i1::g.150559::m.150559